MFGSRKSLGISMIALVSLLLLALFVAGAYVLGVIVFFVIGAHDSNAQALLALGDSWPWPTELVDPVKTKPKAKHQK